ncbi:MAG: hypothetical protein U0586_09945 [Candidatus Brocadiaceae bacterium]
MIDSSVEVGEYTSLAVDTSRQCAHQHFDYANSALKYATNATGSWVKKRVDSSGDVGYTSIAVDTSDKVHQLL